MRRRRSLSLVVIAILGLLSWYVLYTKQVVRELRKAAELQGAMYAVISKAAQEPEASDPIAVILRLQELMNSSGVPFVLTNTSGAVTATENVPPEIERDSARLAQYIRELDARHTPIVEEVTRTISGVDSAVLDSFPVDTALLNPVVSTIHYGDLPLVKGLTVIPLLQAGAIVLLLAFGLYALKERGRADREKVWAGMAREAAHQLGTPLSSLGGWIELLDGRNGDATSTRAVTAMQQDLVRLERVSHRFERIGRPPRKDAVDAAALVERLAAYFAARAPTLGRQVEIVSERPSQSVMVAGDGVLLEWVLEVLIKNAIDALGGRSGKVTVSALPLPEGSTRIRVADDGPGVPRELRKRIFDAGFSTKQAGWGIGLSLARRIIEENHGGKLLLGESDHGAVFDVILHA